MTSSETIPRSEGTITTRFDGPIARIVINRPERLNCLVDSMREELTGALDSMGSRPGVQLVIISGAGRAFCGGIDMEAVAASVAAGDHEAFAATIHAGARVIRAIRDLPMPVIAAVNGVASGAGAALAIACDLRIASQDAAIGFAFSRWGLHPDWGATHFLPRLIGTGRAAELFFSGRTLSAAEAHRIGLFERIVPAANFEDAISRYAMEIAEKPPQAMRLLRRTLFGGSARIALEEALRQEAEAQIACFRSGDLRSVLDRRG